MGLNPREDKAILDVLHDNQDAVTKIKNRDHKVLNFLTGEVMKLCPSSNPKEIGPEIEKAINNMPRETVQKFKLKRTVIEAMQFNDLDDYLKIFHWMKDCGDTFAMANEVSYSTPIMILQTSGGARVANSGDWITRDEKNEFYPVRQDIFEAEYEKVS